MSRNKFVYRKWVLEKIYSPSILQNFDCGDEDLNDYYRNDVVHHYNQLLTQTYCFHHQDEKWVTSYVFVDLCNDSVKYNELTSSLRGQIPEKKQRYKFFPAVKITRLGVDTPMQGKNIGSLLLDAIKNFFLEENRTGCRFITVDAYTNPRTVNFYRRNGFCFLKKDYTEEEIKELRQGGKRLINMVFDLKQIKTTEN